MGLKVLYELVYLVQQIVIKSDQNGIESPSLRMKYAVNLPDKIRPKWD